jgi:hypothetical protein
MEASMDRKKSKWLAMALAAAFAGATAYAADNSLTASDPAKGTTTDKATSYDTGKTAPYSGAEGVKSTPPASDEDHNDNGGVRGKHHYLPHKSSKTSEPATNVTTSPTTGKQPTTGNDSSANNGAAPSGSDANQQKSTNGQ